MSITISGPGFNASGIPSGTILSPGDIAALNVTFTPAGTGSQTGSVTVTSNAGSPKITVALQASGVPAGEHAATVSWDASPSLVSGYFVYRSANGGPYTRLNSTSDTTYTDLSVVAGQTYSYVVTAVNDIAESGYSDPATATIPTP
jgi:fibronectin type 3 domain-containing protein